MSKTSEQNLRRAYFVYEAHRLQMMCVTALNIPKSWHERDQEFKAQYLELIEMMCGSEPEEPEDEVFVALCEIAREYIGPVPIEIEKLVYSVRETISALEAAPSLSVPETHLLRNLRGTIKEWEVEGLDA